MCAFLFCCIFLTSHISLLPDLHTDRLLLFNLQINHLFYTCLALLLTFRNAFSIESPPLGAFSISFVHLVLSTVSGAYGLGATVTVSYEKQSSNAVNRRVANLLLLIYLLTNVVFIRVYSSKLSTSRSIKHSYTATCTAVRSVCIFSFSRTP